MQTLQTLGIARCHKGGVGDKVHQQLNTGLAVERAGVIAAVGVELLDLFGRGAKGVDVLVAHEFGDLDIGAVERAQGQSTVEHELHVGGAARLLGGQADLLGDVGGGNHALGSGDVIVLDHDDLQVGSHVGIVCDPLRQRQDQMDDVLGDSVGRCRLAAKDDGDGVLRSIAVLDVEVLPDDVEREHLLALVLVDTLDLNIDDRVGGNGHALLERHELAHDGLGLGLGGGQALKNVLVVGEFGELAQVAGAAPIGTDYIVEQAGERRVGSLDPAAEGDAVGLVGELLGIDLVERAKLGVLQDLGVEGGDAIDGEAKVNVHVGHVDGAVLVDDGDARVAMLGLGNLIEFDDDVGDGGGDLLQAGERPFLERLGKDRVVGVGDHGAYDGHGLVKLDVVLGGEQPDELGNDHGGVRIVNLDHSVVGQIVQVAAALYGLVDQELGGIAHHEVLLVDAKQAALLIGIIRIEEQGEVLGDLGLVEVDGAAGDQALVDTCQVKQAQAVLGGLAITGHIDVDELGGDGKITKLDGVGAVVIDQDVLLAEPLVGDGLLLIVGKALAEQAVMVVEAHAVTGEAQRGNGIQEACGQAAQAAVAERRLDLELLDLVEVVAGGDELVLNLVIDAEVDHIVDEQLADQKLGRDVVELFLAVVERTGGRALLHELDQQLINTTVIELLERGAKGLLGKIRKIDTGHVSSCGELTTCQKFKRSPREGLGWPRAGKAVASTRWGGVGRGGSYWGSSISASDGIRK